MIKTGYALVQKSTGAELAWWETIPERVDVPGTTIVVFGATSGWRNADYEIAPRNRDVTDPVVITPAETMPALTREKLIAGLLDADLITPEEAAADGTGAIPAAIRAVIDTVVDPKARAREIVRWHNMTLAYRDHPLTQMVKASRPGMTDGDVDALWRHWATL